MNRTLEPYRGCHTFIRSIPYIQQRLPDAQIVIVGETSGVSYGSPAPIIAGKMYFCPKYLENMMPILFILLVLYPILSISLLQVSSCHVYLTYPFVLSWSMLEAMSISVPLVASNTPPVTEYVKHNHNGLLVDFFDPIALSSAVYELVTNNDLAHSLSTSARQTILDNCSIDVCVPRQLSLIDLVATNSL